MFTIWNYGSINIYALTSAGRAQSSYGIYCPSDRLGMGSHVDGTDLKTCLGDEFSTSWMENADIVEPNQETLK